MQAIKYARGHLAPWATVYLQDLQVTKQVQSRMQFSCARIVYVRHHKSSQYSISSAPCTDEQMQCEHIPPKHQDVLPLNKYRAVDVLTAVTL